MIIDTENATEDEAIQAYFAMSQRFGWQGTFFTREDAETVWQNSFPDPETGLIRTDGMPDDVWEAIRNCWYWRKGLSDILTERGWEIVNEAVDEVVGAD